MNLYVLPVIILFILTAVFGVYFMFGPMHGSMGCPLMRGEMALCGTSILAHLNHWQIAFASILVEILLLAAFALAFLRQWHLTTLPERSLQQVRIRSRAPDRPTRMQELFSRGILNRKEPYGDVV